MKFVNHYLVTLFGIYKETEKEDIPNMPGIYLVYDVAANGERTLLYVGESSNVFDRLNGDHEKRDEWEACKSEAGSIEYAILQHEDFTTEYLRKITENAFIYCHKPPINEDGKESFNYDYCIDITFKGQAPPKINSQFRVCGEHNINNL